MQPSFSALRRRKDWWFIVGRYLEARKELETLRVSIARVAQKLNVSGVHGDRDSNFEMLTDQAKNEERGWNALCNDLVQIIEADRRYRNAVAAEIDRLSLIIESCVRRTDS